MGRDFRFWLLADILRGASESPLYPRKQTFRRARTGRTQKADIQCPLLTHSGRSTRCHGMSAYDPKRTFGSRSTPSPAGHKLWPIARAGEGHLHGRKASTTQASDDPGSRCRRLPPSCARERGRHSIRMQFCKNSKNLL